MTVARTILSAFLGGLLSLAAGCIELQLIGQDTQPGADGTSTPTDGSDTDSDVDAGQNVPEVTLRVSNPTPQVNEQVVLTCAVVNDAASPITFDFQPARGRLLVDRARGTASFIVAEADIGAALSFTCTAANDSGISQASDVQRIIPTSSGAPFP
jgi:hypothetical protein